MIKILLSLIFSLIIIPSVAQIEKGTIYIGASSNMNFATNLKEEGGDVFDISGSAGYFPLKNLLIGGGAGYGMVDDFFLGRDHVLILQIFGRYYVKSFFISSGYQSFTFNDVGSRNAFMLQAGYAIFLNDNIALEPSFNYAISLEENYFNVYTLNMGFGLYFNRKEN